VVGELVDQDFRFRPIVAGPGVTITNIGNDLIISSVGGAANSLQGAYDISGSLVLDPLNPLLVTGTPAVNFNNEGGISQGAGPVANRSIGGGATAADGDTILLWPPANDFPAAGVAHVSTRFVGYDATGGSYVGLIDVKFDPSNTGDELRVTTTNLGDPVPNTTISTSFVGNQVRYVFSTVPGFNYIFNWVTDSYIVER
jgi:hypothetical protein